MATKQLNGNSVEVVSVKGGWTTYIDASGSTRRARNSKFDGAKATRPRAAKKAAKANTEGARTIAGTAVKRFANYERVRREGAGVSFDSGDKVARELRDLDIEKVYNLAAREIRAAGSDEFGGTIDDVEAQLLRRYKHLNVGMQRMNLGNRIRGARAAK